jgi:hypothetical protein
METETENTPRQLTATEIVAYCEHLKASMPFQWWFEMVVLGPHASAEVASDDLALSDQDRRDALVSKLLLKKQKNSLDDFIKTAVGTMPLPPKA